MVHIHYDILGNIGDIISQLRQGRKLEFQHADRGGKLLRHLEHGADDENAFLLGFKLHGKIFDHAADHVILQIAMEVLENIENGRIGRLLGDEIKDGNGIALAHCDADIKAGGKIPADDPHVFQLGGAVPYDREEAFLLPCGDIHNSTAGADSKIEFFTEIHIGYSFRGKMSEYAKLQVCAEKKILQKILQRSYISSKPSEWASSVSWCRRCGETA